MTECPFLSTVENEVECFRDCAFYDWKENDGLCPFRNLSDYRIHKLSEFDDYGLIDKDITYVKALYSEKQNGYMKI